MPRRHLPILRINHVCIESFIMFIGIGEMADKENYNYYHIGPKQFHEFYNERKKAWKCSEDYTETDNYDTSKAGDRYGNLITDSNKTEEQESNTQNTQDSRKRDEICLEELGFSFSGEKPLKHFTRFDIYPKQKCEEDVSIDLEQYNVPDEICHQKNKNLKICSR